MNGENCLLWSAAQRTISAAKQLYLRLKHNVLWCTFWENNPLIAQLKWSSSPPPGWKEKQDETWWVEPFRSNRTTVICEDVTLWCGKVVVEKQGSIWYWLPIILYLMLCHCYLLDREGIIWRKLWHSRFPYLKKHRDPHRHHRLLTLRISSLAGCD